ncbi:hypothetical protein [Staphylococcus pettenkoferi]|uniref:hypothetical protein n=1 Tax=Staphylococcus pettenkoferi TaxID=170573 RepID=UPI002553E045|nr:hypothetical protein [Staphylococcus pettenkoferi]MDK7284310.1 hypothetical protein [Staphylococcus pettenkoferi]
MKFSQEHPIWNIIVNAYTHNQQPFIFILANIFFLIALVVAVYGFIKWKSEDSPQHFTTIIASVISTIFIIFALIYVFNPNNQVGTYKGSASIAFTTPVNHSNDKIAVLSSKDAEDSDINSFIMKSEDMKNQGIKAGKTVKVEAHNKPKPDTKNQFIKLGKNDIKEVTISSNITKYNKQQQKAEEAKKKEEKAKKEKEKKKKEEKKKEKK